MAASSLLMLKKCRPISLQKIPIGDASSSVKLLQYYFKADADTI